MSPKSALYLTVLQLEANKPICSTLKYTKCSIIPTTGNAINSVNAKRDPHTSILRAPVDFLRTSS